MTTNGILGLLATKYGDGWSRYTELRHPTSSRSIDFVAVGAWPSQGERVISFEVKVSRGDFLRELREPTKRKWAEDISTETWFTSPPKTINVEELPEGWGLLLATDGGLKVQRAAVQRSITQFPFSLVSALARRATDPPTATPKKLWKYAGQELTYQDLQRIFDASIVPDASKIRADAEAEFYKKHRATFDIANLMISKSGCRTAAEVERWVAGRTPYVDRSRARELKWLIRNSLRTIADVQRELASLSRVVEADQTGIDDDEG